MEEMQITSNLTWIEVQFAKKAVDEVIKCRNTLQWTYAMAYYLVRIVFAPELNPYLSYFGLQEKGALISSFSPVFATYTNVIREPEGAL
jgi:hypothetical protein